MSVPPDPVTRPKVLLFTTVFPNPTQPLHGLFVAERARHLADHADIRVVAPVARFPWRPWCRDRHRQEQEMAVEHPTFRYVPGLFKSLDGLFLFLSSVRTVARLRAEFDFDLIDAHFAYPEGFAAVLLGRLFRRPVTLTLRGTEIQMADFPLRGPISRWTMRRADEVIAVSRPLADLARETGVPPDRVTGIENGVDGERFRPADRVSARQRLGLSTDGPLIVSVGHRSPRKGFQRVLRVLPTLLHDFPALRFAVVGGPGGEGDNGPDLERQARALGLADHLILAGARPPEEIAQWLNAADVFVLASDLEGCPNVVWEALACGRPVVASKVGHVEHMVPAFAGIVFGEAEDGPALENALREALRRPWNSGAIRDFAARHTWEGVARRVLSVWRRVGPFAQPSTTPSFRRERVL